MMINDANKQGGLDLSGGRDRRAIGIGGNTVVNDGCDNPYALREDEIVIDAFCGAGGTSASLHDAIGRHPDIAINHWDVAIATHLANFPDTIHYRASVYALDPREIVPAGKTVGLLWASPDCFTDDALVLTREGLKRIDQVMIGDLLLTHKGRWRPVTKIWSQTSETVEVKGYGHYGLITTPGHSFYSKRIVKRYPKADKLTGKRPGEQRTLIENPYWPEACDMAGKLWATPHMFPENTMPICTSVEFSDDFFYFLGRWLGDGSINKGDVEICAGMAEVNEMDDHFNAHPLRNAQGESIAFRKVDRKTTMAYVWGNAPLTRWLEREAGRLCEDKQLPVWCLSMQRSWRQALLNGYIDADGYIGRLRTTATSVSKHLIIGMRLLATSLGHDPSLHMTKGTPGEIEGRPFNGRDRYEIGWTRENTHHTTHRDSLHLYTPVRKVTPAGSRQVFCLQVEEDESFVADGIVVHNCREFSRAKNGKPRSPSIRMLADSVVHYAKLIKPRAIAIENVREFSIAGPLDENGKIIKERKGEIFDRWINDLKALGYAVEWRILNSANYGAPTLRERFFLQARLDGLPIIWPDATHGDPDSDAVKAGRLLPWRSAAECLEFDLPTPSIFLDREGARISRCKRPLAASTLRRIARGIFRDVVNTKQPFIVTYYGERRADEGFRGSSIDRPFATQTAGGNRFGVVVPLTHQGADRVYPIGDPFRTITGAHRGELAYVAATMVQTGYGERPGQKPRSLHIERPLGAVVAGGGKHAVVATTMTCFNQNSAPRSPALPMRTVMAGATRHAVIEGVLDSHIDRTAEVDAFLWEHRGLSDRPVTKAPDGNVLVDGRPHGILDIGLRMVNHRELSRAMGFNDDPAKGPVFDPTRQADGTLNSGENIVKMIGNAVSPPNGAAVMRGIFGVELERQRKVA